MKKALFALSLATIITTLPGCTAEQTWTGTISDSRCGVYHEWDEHSVPMTEKDCTIKCVKGGAKYVFRSEDRTYQIKNQDHPALAEDAGGAVQLTGRIANETITVSSITRR
jgi:hypothetical protein